MLKHLETTDPTSCLSKAGDDEPLFVLRAKDPLAPTVVRAWASTATLADLHAEKLDEALECADAMDEWRHARYPDKEAELPPLDGAWHEITTHHTNECNKAITISADERDQKNGGASHEYIITILGEDGEVDDQLALEFQRGPIKEVGTNGITHEVLLAVLIDRLEGFQAGPYANVHNAVALGHVRAAFDALEARTREREARGVEGTHTV